MADDLQKITLGGGCFWCTQAVFKRLKGVVEVVPGYAGGYLSVDGAGPIYEEVCSGTSGHAEVIQVTFDPATISYETLLEVFWKIHDPTTFNKQSNDVGEQYRSVIFYHDEGQRVLAEESKKKLEQSGYYKDPIITQIVPLTKFYPAENYHQDFYDRNRQNSYCRVIIDPKTQKLFNDFGKLVKS